MEDMEFSFIHVKSDSTACRSVIRQDFKNIDLIYHSDAKSERCFSQLFDGPQFDTDTCQLALRVPPHFHGAIRILGYLCACVITQPLNGICIRGQIIIEQLLIIQIRCLVLDHPFSRFHDVLIRQMRNDSVSGLGRLPGKSCKSFFNDQNIKIRSFLNRFDRCHQPCKSTADHKDI